MVKGKTKIMNDLKDILKHQSKIVELQHQFDCRFSETDYDDITIDDIIDVAIYTKELFEEEGHYLYESRLGYSTFNNDYDSNQNLVKQYNQIKYFIRKYNKQRKIK